MIYVHHLRQHNQHIYCTPLKPEERLNMPTVVKFAQFKKRKSAELGFLGGFGGPIVVFCMIMALVMAAYIFYSGESPTIWQDPGTMP
jgi:hypothetical protein